MTLHLTKENFEKEVIGSKIPVIVDFWASWCGPCQMFGPIFEKVSSQYEGKIKFAKLNVDESPEISSKFEVMSIPTIKIFQNGKIKDEQTGVLSENDLINWINNNL